MTSNQIPTLPILVTGATGFVGQQLCAHLVSLGYSVWGLTRDPGRARRILGAKVHLISELDAARGQAFYGVVNLAGEPLAKRRWSPEVKQTIRDSRIRFTEKLLAFFHHEGRFPQVLINGSAIGIYGNAGAKLLTETSPLAADFAAQLCRDWEVAAQRFAQHGTRVCVLRIGVVLDKNGGALQQMLPAFRLGLGGPLANGQHFMSWIHRQDLIGLITWCLTHQDISGVINAVAPEPVTNKQFAITLAKALHRPALFPMPGFMLRLLFGEIADALLLSSQRVIPEQALADGYEFTYPSLASAFAEIVKK